MNYQLMIDEINKRNIFGSENGMFLEEASEGYARSVMKVRARHANPIGSIHGGCLYTIADTTAGVASMSYGKGATTMNSDMHFLNAGIDTTSISCEAHVVKRGKRTLVVEAKVFDQDKKMLAMGTFTYMVLDTVHVSSDM